MKKTFVKKAFLISSASIAFLLIGVVCTMIVSNLMSTPSNDRDWSPDQAILSKALFDNDMVTITNIRNFAYTSTTTYTPAYYDKIFNLTELSSVDYIVEPFSKFGMAHTFLSFGFKNGAYVSISIEIRKQKGERFSPFKGLFNQYEIMYVIADEHDVLPLRAIHRKDHVYLYPIKITDEALRSLFVGMLNRANTLTEKPEFYNTITNTCTTNILDHMNAITEKKASWDIRVYVPDFSDRFAYDLGLIDTTATPKELRTRHEVTDLIKQYVNHPDFSKKIRGF